MITHFWLRLSGWVFLAAAFLAFLLLLTGRGQPGVVMAYSTSDQDKIITYYIDIERRVRVQDLSPIAYVRVKTSDTDSSGRRIIPLMSSDMLDTELFLNAPGAESFQLTYSSDFPSTQANSPFPQGGGNPPRLNAYPVWTPDGGWVVFLSADEVGNIDLYAIRPDRSELRLLAQHVLATQPVWVQIGS